jgi:hypothetical protein
MIASAVTRGEVMSAVGSHTAGSPEFPPGIDVRWETVRRVKWNEQRHASEECELVYEVSWNAEIGVWRRFLRSQQTVNG